MDEIKEVVFSCEWNKSPDPDGFNLEFLKKCWEVVREDMMKCIQEFHSTIMLPRALTLSFLAIVPKSYNPQGLEEYMPICLIGYLYKVISRILAARLRCVIGKLISKSQTTFIPGRQILDGVVVTNELLDYAKRKKKSCLLFKVDFAQAYDCVDWKFLMDMLEIMDFGLKWLKWMD